MARCDGINLLKHFMRNENVRWIQAHLPELNFITIHYSYFIITCLMASLIFWGSSDPAKSISYTDSLFLVTSAMTQAGLNTVNLSQMNTFQQFILWFLILIGSSIFVSIGTVLTRKRAFEIRFNDLVKRQKEALRIHRRSLSISASRLNTEKVDAPTLNERSPTNGETKKADSNSAQVDPTTEFPQDAIVPTQLDQTHAEHDQSNDESGPPNRDAEEHLSPLENARSHVSFMSMTPPSRKAPQHHHRLLTFAGVGAHPSSTSVKFFNTEGMSNRGPRKVEGSGEHPELHHWQYPNYLAKYTIGRNGQVYNISKAEREHLGGVEYRAITLLAWVVPIYYVLWQLLGAIGLGAWIASHMASTARENGIAPWWLGVFNCVSAFNNSGMSLLDANMIPFQKAVYPVVTMGLLILAGNTAYPLFLRFILWTMLKLLCWIYPSDGKFSDYKATIRFVLKYPRRVYTNLFPSGPTWWLLFTVVTLNATDWVAFELINIGNSAVEAIPTNYRVLDGLFQALAVRSGGFYIISITSLRIGVQVLYVIMMYISVYPVSITMRHSNVYEERSLGIYASQDEFDPCSDTEAKSKTKSRRLGPAMTKFRKTLTIMSHFPNPTTASPITTGAHFVRQQVRGQLAHDLWWLVLAILLISCIEVSNFERDPVTYSVFNIVFEVVSGYGCVGISTGLPNEAYSFSGGWHKCSKLILGAVMLRGRHRGLPVALDRAVRLPDEGEIRGKEEDESGRWGGSGNGMQDNAVAGRRPSWARNRSMGALSDL